MNPAGQTETAKQPREFTLYRRQFVTVQNAHT
jgi:hypothetical protein